MTSCSWYLRVSPLGSVSQRLGSLWYQSEEGVHSVPSTGPQQGPERTGFGRTTQTWRHQPGIVQHVRDTLSTTLIRHQWFCQWVVKGQVPCVQGPEGTKDLMSFCGLKMAESSSSRWTDKPETLSLEHHDLQINLKKMLTCPWWVLTHLNVLIPSHFTHY